MSPNAAREEADKCGIWSASDTGRCHQSNKMINNDLNRMDELALCGHCKRIYNDTNLLPKDLDCKHTLCLECIETGLAKASASEGATSRLAKVYCEICWKPTELTLKGPQALETNTLKLDCGRIYGKHKAEIAIPNGGDATNPRSSSLSNLVSPFESCGTHSSPLGLWCIDCEKLICTECQRTLHHDSRFHRIWTQQEAKDQLVKQAYAELLCMSHLDDNIRQLARRQRQFLILIRDACTALIREVQSSLDSDWNVDPTVDIRKSLTQIQLALMDAKSPKEVHQLFPVLLLKKQDLQAKCQEMVIQCQLNDLIGHSEVVFNFDSLRESVSRILSNENGAKPISLQQPLQDPILFLTNYCMSQLFTRLHQRANGDSFHLNHNMQRQLVIEPPNVPANSIPAPVIPPTPQNIPLNETSEIFSNSSNINLPLDEYSSPQPKPVQLPMRPPLEPPEQPTVRSPTPPHPTFDPTLQSPPRSPSPCYSPPPTTVVHKITTQATVAQIVQMHHTTTDVTEEADLPTLPIIHPPMRPVPARSLANVCPRYFFNIDINGIPKGKIVIETRPDVAPKMCRNFDRLTTADRKASYKGCNFFQCWKNESVITGDYEFNTGRGGRSIYEDGYFQPDETRLPAVRGAVGMRRQQKKHEHFGLVGSQFRIILQDMQGFTGIFGQVVEGIELVEIISNFGDHTGKPMKTISVSKCGKL